LTPSSCSVLVSSCDAYSDLWTPFFTLFWRNWPDCPYPVYLGANQARYDHPRVRTLQAGPDESWSANLRFFLDQLGSEYVLLLLEDFFLVKPVPPLAVSDQLKALDALRGTVVRLFPNPPPHMRMQGHAGIGSIHRFAPFRVSAQAAIWRRSDLLGLLREGESAWEFERNGTIRSQSRADGFYCTYEAILQYVHVVEQGRWFRSAVRRFGSADIGCNFEARPVIPRGLSLKKSARSAIQGIANRTQSLRLRMQRGGRSCHESLS
jgi:hypothetical protein